MCSLRRSSSLGLVWIRVKMGLQNPLLFFKKVTGWVGPSDRPAKTDVFCHSRYSTNSDISPSLSVVFPFFQTNPFDSHFNVYYFMRSFLNFLFQIYELL